jgi:MFS family permease
MLLLAWSGLGVLAFGVRFLVLDHLPLSETEAALAVKAWSAVHGNLDDSLVATGAPLFAHLLAGTLFLLGASDIAARAAAALGGVGLALAPALLSATIGRRTAIVAGLLFALSPVAVQVSRTADPAALTAAIVLVILASVVRLASDRPWWAPWTLAVGLGLALADEAGVVVAAGTAALAAAATWGWSPTATVRFFEERRTWEQWSTLAGPAALGAIVAVVAATGALMSLDGVGFIFGGLWGDLGRIVTPAPFPTRNLATLLAYAWPIIGLAIVGFVLRLRRGDRLALFFAQWALLLFALSAVVGQSVLTLAMLPLVPGTLLAAMAVDDLLPDGLSAWVTPTAAGGALLLFLVGGALIIGFGQWVGANRATPPIGVPVGTAAGYLLLLVVVVAVWRSQMDRGQRGAAVVMCLALAWGAFTFGSIGRLSYGGSEPGTEPLPREITSQELRDTFAELTLLANADPSRILAIDSTTPAAVRWYGREIRSATLPGTAPRPFTLHEAPPQGSTAADLPLHTPLKVTSSLNRGDLNPLGIARWLVSRVGLIQGKTSDIIISR